MEEKIKHREYGLDFLRIFATFLIILTHFFLWNNYYNVNPKTGLNMHVQIMVRNISKSCVPLFIMITGYFNSKKEYNKKFFKGLLNIIIVYIFFYTLNYIFLYCRDIYKGNNVDNYLNFKKYLSDMFSFLNYYWYIGFYIGLYLFSPILNLGYEGLKDKNKEIFLGFIVFFSFGVPFLNAIFKDFLKIPEFWGWLYTFAYYFVGKYIKEKQFHINKRLLLTILIINTILGIFEVSTIKVEDYSLPGLVQSILLFLLFYDLKFTNKFIQKILGYMSSISLDIYLATQITDSLCYSLIFKKFDLNSKCCQEIFYYAPICIVASFLTATILASVRKFLIRVR